MMMGVSYLQLHWFLSLLHFYKEILSESIILKGQLIKMDFPFVENAAVSQILYFLIFFNHLILTSQICPISSLDVWNIFSDQNAASLYSPQWPAK